MLMCDSDFLYNYRGMLEEAQLPPSIEHAYAKWLKKSDQQEIVQPSPYKLPPSAAVEPVCLPLTLSAEAG